MFYAAALEKLQASCDNLLVNEKGWAGFSTQPIRITFT
jgi:hypothetical protein